ncbi:MAG: hypothetical protein U5M23_00985 [Marinagarivorans sp.]|nr:hypothetical protein [Marinagarivorans sp.]
MQQLQKFRDEIAAQAQAIGNNKEFIDKIYAGTIKEAWPESALSLYGVFS